MASKETVYKENKFSKSLGAGMKSLIGGGGRTYYVLEHKVSSDNHRAGEIQEIIIDYIELGRDPKCQVCFGNSFPTVHRRHAAITKEGNNWVLKTIKKDPNKQYNPTLINGKPISKQWFLQNGDEIQLSMEGPKLRFLIPSNPQIGSIGFTRRFSLFRQQALRPYKQAITALSVIFLAALGVLLYLTITAKKDIEKSEEMFSQMLEDSKRKQDSLTNLIANSEQSRIRIEDEMRRIRQTVANNRPENTTTYTPQQPVETSFNLDSLFPSVYYIKVNKIILTYQGTTEEITDYKWSGTGFLLTDKRFITARHVVEPWFFLTQDDEVVIALNKIANNNGTVVVHFSAYSPSGASLQFKNTDFVVNRATDETIQARDNDGNQIVLKTAKLNDGNDWASFPSTQTGLIEADANLAINLRQQTKLHILGYPLGLGANSPGNITPIYGNCIVSANGLQNGVIYVTDRNFEQGNSGGPVFYYDASNNKYKAIGIVSAGAGGSIGFIIPISAIR